MPATERLALYHYTTCGFCRWVRGVIDELGVPVELRDIHRDPRHMADLLAARGRRTVPVLRREQPDGTVEWLGESRDIIAYLNATYGRA